MILLEIVGRGACADRSSGFVSRGPVLGGYDRGPDRYRRSLRPVLRGAPVRFRRMSAAEQVVAEILKRTSLIQNLRIRVETSCGKFKHRGGNPLIVDGGQVSGTAFEHRGFRAQKVGHVAHPRFVAVLRDPQAFLGLGDRTPWRLRCVVEPPSGRHRHGAPAAGWPNLSAARRTRRASRGAWFPRFEPYRPIH